MKTILAALVLCLMAAGCSTRSAFDVQQMSDKAPVATYATAKTVGGVRECIETGVRAVAKSGHTVGTRMDGNGETVWVTAFKTPVIAVRIEPSSDGAAVEYRQRFRTGMGDYTNAVLACR